MKKYILLLLLIFCAGVLFGQEFRLITFADYYGDIEPGTDYETIRNRYFLQPKIFAPLADGAVELNVSANLWYQPLPEEDEWQDTLIDPQNILHEAYIAIPLEQFDIFLGQKYVTFGFGDVFSPLNVVNGADTTSLSLDDRYFGKRPDAVAQLLYYPNYNDFFEVVYKPFTRPDYEPKGMVALDNGLLDAKLDFDTQAYLTKDPHSVFLRYYHMSNSFDLQLVYGWYTRQSPSFELDNLSAGATLTGSAETAYDRSQLFGAGISTIVGDVALSQELGFDWTNDLEGDDIGVKNSSLTSNTQLTGSAFSGALWQLSIIYAHILNFDAGTTFSSAIDEDLRTEINDYYNQPVQNIAFAIGHIEKSFLRNKLLLAANGGFFFSTRFYIAPRVAYALSDRLRLELGADIWTAEPKDNDLMRQSDADNLFLRIKYEY